MKHKSFQGSTCPVARSMDSIGEWWSMLIIRDAMLGVSRFSDFQRSLGMARNVLTTRLRRLVALGIFKTIPASDGSAYREYVLTEKGRDLLPAMIAIRQWGEKYLFSDNEPRSIVLDKKHHQPLRRMEVQDVNGDKCTTADLELLNLRPRQRPRRNPLKSRAI